MKNNMIDFENVNKTIDLLNSKINNPDLIGEEKNIKVGIDLGTAYTVLIVCDDNNMPLSTRIRKTDVVRDGLVVDYMEAKKIVTELKEETEKLTKKKIIHAAIAVPPGTGENDSKTHKYVVEGAGINVSSIVDEPTAANAVLKIKNGAVVDIGGGTTGISIFKDGKVVYAADEPTGGVHFTYVIAGHYKISFDKAEKIKTDPANSKDVYAIVIPVMQKIASIINKHIKGYDVSSIVLCGGTSRLIGIEKVISIDTKVQTEKPKDPFLITPLGIALNDLAENNSYDIKNNYGGIYDIS